MLRGAVAGVAARTVSAPVDLLKIRFQTQNSARRQYPTILAACRSVLREEGGLGAFWKGNVSGLCLYASFNAVQFGVYEELKRRFPTLAFAGYGSLGAASALSATLLSYPFDLMRTRHSLQSPERRHYRGVLHTLLCILREEGPAGLYRGIAPSLFQVVPYMALVFASYEKSKSLLAPAHWSPVSADFLAAAVSGLVGKLALMPIDVVRRRLQIQGGAAPYVLRNAPRYSGLCDTVRRIWAVEGLLGFYSGTTLAVLKSVPVTVVTFVTYGLLDRARTRTRNVK